MGSAQSRSLFPLTALAVVLLVEAGVIMLAGQNGTISRLCLIGIARLLQAVLVCTLAVKAHGGPGIVGLGRDKVSVGLKIGLRWSAGFAAVAGLGFAAIRIAGQHPLALIRTPLPSSADEMALFFIVGGILAPITEEIVFRGVVFGHLRRWGVTTAVVVSTALFALVHGITALPITQIVGGAVFAVAYHKSGSLIAPMIIHSLGNLAIFTLNLPLWY